MTNTTNMLATDIKANGGFKQMLEEGFAVYQKCLDYQTRMQYLTSDVFSFTLYDSAMHELFGQKAVEVCQAISGQKTFEYIEDHGNYQWFLVMCNMPFFSSRIEWGTSVRGAWWGMASGQPFVLESTGFFLGDEQITTPVEFTQEEWKEFIQAVIEFATQADPVAASEGSHENQ